LFIQIIYFNNYSNFNYIININTPKQMKFLSEQDYTNPISLVEKGKQTFNKTNFYFT